MNSRKKNRKEKTVDDPKKIIELVNVTTPILEDLSDALTLFNMALMQTVETLKKARLEACEET